MMDFQAQLRVEDVALWVHIALVSLMIAKKLTQIHYNGFKSAAVALRKQCLEQQAEIQKLNRQLKEQSRNAIQASRSITLDNRVTDLDEPTPCKPSRASLKRSYDPAYSYLERRRNRPFTQVTSRVEEVEESPRFIGEGLPLDRSSDSRPTMSSFSLASSSSLNVDDDLNCSPAFSTPFTRSNISPKRKSSTSSNDLVLYNRSSSVRCSTGKRDWLSFDPIARPIAGNGNKIIGASRIRSIRNK